MATKKVSQGTRAPKKRAEKPVTRIKEAAERAGIPARVSEEPGERKITITLQRACDLIAWDIQPEHFHEHVFKALARDVATLSDLAEHVDGFEGWSAFWNLRERILFAGKVSSLLRAQGAS